MKALSFKQPWAWLVFHGKDVDNRSRRLNSQGRIVVHASRQWDTEGMRWLLAHKDELDAHAWWDEMMIANAKDEMPFGALVGEVNWHGHAPDIISPWYFGTEYQGRPNFGHPLANPQAYETPIPYKGQLGFFEVEGNDH